MVFFFGFFWCGFQMEALYSKLYDKYTKLKKEKEYQFDELNYEQEVKFLKYEADKELSEEISRLQDKKCSSYTMPKETGQENLHNTPGEQSQGTSPAKSSKKRKYVHISEHAAAPYVDVEVDHPSGQLVPRDKSSGAPSIQQPACCLRTTNSSGGDAADTSSFNCMFQYLVEYVVGLKVSPVAKSNEVSILARHQSSGYSFSLTWITKADGEVELLYRVLSLGTFERVAPEWMKETLMFSSSMCSLFFQRVSRVINT
ncbi:hypothetical protein SASPL_126855 [Salvia splendens]|uniref:DUF7806 domain-containing protein n=1 Tax=Salvia splendens TaxID=180675 RepID=A0A8X8ZQE8_SALSN|nr:hypothetical protein SASPL_126855 [Salvia splendens]